ncbi:putative bifunctional diguanylate cyclase/phosphodiesterase [Roseibium algae]|uniref:Bifunctional diguanylate cyclase/phosphodiesterase n=1 Tax=Roseibium algae TaxID=3123038 RepID=A0ABU8TPN7_9HYPH
MATVTERSGGRIANAIIIPMIAVVVLAVACVFGLMIWSSHLSDESAETSQRSLLKGAIDLKLDQMARQQVGTVSWDKAYFKASETPLDQAWLKNNIGQWLDETYGFCKTVLITSDLKTPFQFSSTGEGDWVTPELMEQLNGAVAKTRARAIISFKKTPSGLYKHTVDTPVSSEKNANTGLVKIGDGVYFYSAAAITPELHTITANRRAPAVLVNFDKLDSDIISKIAGISGLDGLSLTKSSIARPSLASLELRSPKGQLLGYLQWRANKPGTEMLRRIAPVLLILALAIVGLTVGVMDFTRQTTRNLSQSQAKAVYTARHDALSGLPNREQFTYLLAKALKEPQTEAEGSAVVYIDLDRFKDINDTLGHGAGDEIITAVAARLRAVVPGSGVIARIGGDEFAMLLTKCDSAESVERILTRVQDQLVRPIRIDNNELYVSLSMGAALAPRDGDDPGELLRKADIALYDAKANGRGRWSFFDNSMQEHVQTKDKMSRALRQAIDNDALDIAYQPQCDSSANQIVAVEALARWDHPELGAISPSSFIPLAEETGMINDLGLWILRRACRDAHQWPDVVISVNVSPTQFKHPRFVETILETLEEYNLPPSRLEIEVTESVFAGQAQTILTSMRRLKDRGVKVALDDFGSGYSSLSYLRTFPFDTLKIDRDFISNMDQGIEAQAILTTIIQLGQALGMTIVAEGIETSEQLKFLADSGCHRMQGYYISRPLPDNALTAFLEDHELNAAMQDTVNASVQNTRSLKAI